MYTNEKLAGMSPDKKRIKFNRQHFVFNVWFQMKLCFNHAYKNVTYKKCIRCAGGC